MGRAKQRLSFRLRPLSQYLMLAAAAVVAVLAVSCKYFKGKSPVQGEKVIARANDEYLYLSDISGLIRNVPRQDSASFVTNYAESWVRRKLLLKKAEENVPADELGIDKKVEDYRQSLLLYEYEKALINQKLDKAIGETEIQEFYDKNKDNFTLENDIYDLQFVQINAGSKDLDQMRRVILTPHSSEDTLEREGYCKAMASSYSFAPDNWMAQSAVLKQFPLTMEDLKKLAAAGKFAEFKNNLDIFFIQVRAIKHQGEISPLAYIHSQIKEIMINKKKVSLIQKIYDGIYQEGIRSGKCEVLVRR